jgi:hypothetical protein
MLLYDIASQELLAILETCCVSQVSQPCILLPKPPALTLVALKKSSAKPPCCPMVGHCAVSPLGSHCVITGKHLLPGKSCSHHASTWRPCGMGKVNVFPYLYCPLQIHHILSHIALALLYLDSPEQSRHAPACCLCISLPWVVNPLGKSLPPLPGSPRECCCNA